MNTELKEALKTFTLLLPDGFPENLGNPSDIHSWLDVCYQYCIHNERLSEDDLVEALTMRFSNFDMNEVYSAAKNYMKDYEEYMMVLDYLKNRNLLK